MSPEFDGWLDALKDRTAQLHVVNRLQRAEAGNLGDWKPITGSVSEMRINTGPGYHLYFTRRDGLLIIMLAGGSKST